MPEHPLIGLIMATHLEAKPFLEGIDLRRTSVGPFSAYKAGNIILLITGLGQTNAAMACTCLCMSASPACLVNIGAAGATADGDFPLGSICHVTEALEPDRPHFRTGLPFRHEPDLMQGFRTARLATRDKAVVAQEERREMARIADLSDMEGAAVVQAAAKFQVPCFLFKLVSDTPEQTTETEIPAFIRAYRDSLFEFFMTRILPALNARFA